jgi:hypothetical protein
MCGGDGTIPFMDDVEMRCPICNDSMWSVISWRRIVDTPAIDQLPKDMASQLRKDLSKRKRTKTTVIPSRELTTDDEDKRTIGSRSSAHEVSDEITPTTLEEFLK